MAESKEELFVEIVSGERDPQDPELEKEFLKFNIEELADAFRNDIELISTFESEEVKEDLFLYARILYYQFNAAYCKATAEEYEDQAELLKDSSSKEYDINFYKEKSRQSAKTARELEGRLDFMRKGILEKKQIRSPLKPENPLLLIPDPRKFYKKPSQYPDDRTPLTPEIGKHKDLLAYFHQEIHWIEEHLFTHPEQVYDHFCQLATEFVETDLLNLEKDVNNYFYYDAETLKAITLWDLDGKVPVIIEKARPEPYVAIIEGRDTGFLQGHCYLLKIEPKKRYRLGDTYDIGLWIMDFEDSRCETDFLVLELSLFQHEDGYYPFHSALIYYINDITTKYINYVYKIKNYGSMHTNLEYNWEKALFNSEEYEMHEMRSAHFEYGEDIDIQFFEEA